jgi:uncharacterized protein (TIGR03435 family)
MNTIPRISVLLLVSIASWGPAAFAQVPDNRAPAPRLEFEVASLRPSAPNANSAGVGIHVDGQRINCIQLSLTDYLRSAYNVKLHQIEGPAWLPSQKFDLNAKLPTGATAEQVGKMLQSLLEDRFGLKLHRETRDFPIYALIVGKNGLKIKESPADAPAPSSENAGLKPLDVSASSQQNSTTINLGNGSYMTFGDNKFVFRKVPVSSLTDTVANFVDRPIVDMTGIKGNYDFDLVFTPEDFMAMMVRSSIRSGVVLPPEVTKMVDASGPNPLINAVETLGLKLDSRKAPLEVLVIDHMLPGRSLVGRPSGLRRPLEAALSIRIVYTDSSPRSCSCANSC